MSTFTDDPKVESIEAVQLNLFDLLLGTAKHKRAILKWTLGAMLVAAGVSLLFKNTFSSTAVILPPRQDTSLSSLLAGQMGALSSLGGGLGGGGGLSLKDPNSIFTGLLESRTIGTTLVDRFDLKKVYGKKTIEEALHSLASHTKVESGKDNLIRITVSSHDAKFSSDLANAYVDLLHDMNTNLALTDSSQRRLFFQQQLNQEQTALSQAEASLSETQQRTGVMQPTGQADLVARNIATIRSQLTLRQAELQGMSAFAAEGNPDYIQLKEEIGSLQHQLQQAENSQRPMAPGDIEVPTAKLPESALEYARKYRDVKMHEAIYETLVKQYEAAKIDESKTAPMIQVVDRAVPAEKKSGPPRTLIALGVGVLVFLFSVLWYATSSSLELIRQDRVIAGKLNSLRTAFFG